jgi:hypothetical protein
MEGRDYYFAIYDNTPFHIISQKVFPLPFRGVDTNNMNVMNILKDTKIFEANGKKGVRNRYGKTLLLPQFESITLEKGVSAFSSEDKCDLSFHILGSGIDFFLPACTYNLIDSGYLIGFINKTTKCSVCEGAGKYKDHSTTVKVREWVPEKYSSYTTDKTERVWNANSNTYVNVKTPVTTVKTEPGYYKDLGYEIKVTPGGKCDHCINGIESTTRSVLAYDKSYKQYFLKNVTTPRVFKPYEFKTKPINRF